ncbi:polysaccharide pyruvyl transferase family protein [Virgibacillus sp. NKC19-3]|uniref:polysaccharide pyruvyl transferase family protein n=1 Tax=Virgibacillus saliphilus TaxID=2831674 RepID=UPI001C9B94FD|nr:polysaccharide pyruvyl transferase family protein [Virgibacillus sp. NKC19-3]MBY7144599.1 polysaccharide pyruvyl transferase family protein [Virgibacillus sp. NKC19-3]
MQKKVMIYAYTNFNLGDDLFIKLLCERYPKTQFFLYAPREYKHNFKSFRNVSIYSSNNFFMRLLNYGLRKLKIDFSIRNIIARKCDAIVHVGGSIFIQKDNWTGIPNYKQKIKGKPFYVLGSNFGPFQNQQFFTEHYELFKKYTDICFRDKYSYGLFKDLPNVRVADDIVFQLNRKRSVSIKKHIVISVIKPSFRKNLHNYDEIYYQKIKDITIYFVNMGYQVTLMSFCEKEGDQEAVEEILQKLPEEIFDNVAKYYYKYNMEEALDIIASSSYVIATRFHSMILGWVFNKPVFPVSYSKKMNNVMKDIGFQGSYIDLKEINSLKPIDVYECMETNSVDVSVQAKNSKNHFKKLDEYLLNSTNMGTGAKSI